MSIKVLASITSAKSQPHMNLRLFMYLKRPTLSVPADHCGNEDTGRQNLSADRELRLILIIESYRNHSFLHINM